VLYDNEAYMNTGIQRSGGTPHGAATTTTPAGTVNPGKLEYKKPIAEIMLAHEMPYVATASPYYWRDLLVKVRKGLEVDGPAFLHVFAPCIRSWRWKLACFPCGNPSRGNVNCLRQASLLRWLRKRRSL
jgi:pyruvate ferredoxin oxidoreductase beta subunit